MVFIVALVTNLIKNSTRVHKMIILTLHWRKVSKVICCCTAVSIKL